LVLVGKPIILLQEMIEKYVHWNDDIGEWQLKCVAYTGNNMNKPPIASGQEKTDRVSCFTIMLLLIIIDSDHNKVDYIY